MAQAESGQSQRLLSSPPERNRSAHCKGGGDSQVSAGAMRGGSGTKAEQLLDFPWDIVSAVIHIRP